MALVIYIFKMPWLGLSYSLFFDVFVYLIACTEKGCWFPVVIFIQSAFFTGRSDALVDLCCSVKAFFFECFWNINK